MINVLYIDNLILVFTEIFKHLLFLFQLNNMSFTDFFYIQIISNCFFYVFIHIKK